MKVEAKGSLLDGRYRVLKPLGTGGMATVFLCEDERLGRSVAVKRMHAHSAEDMAQRFVREAKLGASLNHPNLVSVFDTVTDDESVLIVMEYVEGRTLGEALKDGPLDAGRALAVVRDVASALDHAHGLGVTHRDIKPANVLLRNDGVTKLVDLGIATVADQTRITRSGTVLGTAAYMAPEQLDGGETGPMTDVYALAVVAYEAFSGAKARTGRTPLEIAHRVATEPAPDLREAWPDAPPALADALCKGMARHPDERPASAGELADELERAMAEDRRTLEGRQAGAAAAAGAGAGAVAGSAAAGSEAAEAAEPGADAAEPVAGGRDTAEAPAPVAGTRDTAEAAGAPHTAEADEPVSRAPDTAEAGDPPEQSREPDPPAEPPRRTNYGAGSAGRRGGPGRPSGRPSRGALAGLAAVLLALAAVIAVATLVSGGDDGKGGERSAGSGKSEQPADKPEEKAKDPAPSDSPAADPAPEQPAAEQSASGQPTSIDPAQGARLDAQAFSLIKQGRYAEAVPIAKRAVASFPEDSQESNYAFALFNLGTALNRSGSPKEAIPYLEKRLSFSNDRREIVQKELDSARGNAGG